MAIFRDVIIRNAFMDTMTFRNWHLLTRSMQSSPMNFIPSARGASLNAESPPDFESSQSEEYRSRLQVHLPS